MNNIIEKRLSIPSTHHILKAMFTIYHLSNADQQTVRGRIYGTFSLFIICQTPAAANTRFKPIEISKNIFRFSRTKITKGCLKNHFFMQKTGTVKNFV